MLVGGRDQRAEGDVQEHGLWQQRHHYRRWAAQRAVQARDQAHGGRSAAANGGCKCAHSLGGFGFSLYPSCDLLHGIGAMLNHCNVKFCCEIFRPTRTGTEPSITTSSSQRRCTWTGWTERSIFTPRFSISTRTTAGNYCRFSKIWCKKLHKRAVKFFIYDLCVYLCSCISKEELEQALREKGLLDGRDIKDIISEVDADNVKSQQIPLLYKSFQTFYNTSDKAMPMINVELTNFAGILPAGWKDRLQRVRGDDAEGKPGGQSQEATGRCDIGEELDNKTKTWSSSSISFGIEKHLSRQVAHTHTHTLQRNCLLLFHGMVLHAPKLVKLIGRDGEQGALLCVNVVNTMGMMLNFPFWCWPKLDRVRTVRIHFFV